ncbi:MAG: hypothetical protein QF380_06415 [Candidatus Marinimicrobia bacterium]|nr:hypothetical protein [Candidatus Neomarinimicrobiota bacterium]
MIRRLIILLLIVGCYPVSHMMVGDAREPISPYEVKVYLDFPEEYETIALIEASSEFAFKDPSINITWQSKSDKIIERLKVEASNLGANGIVIKNTENKNKQNVAFDNEGGGQVTNTHFKIGTATAIFIN